MRRAACVLILRPDGRVLSVSRGLDTRDWALPGGQVERRETLIEAARNELREETGISLDPTAKLNPIYADSDAYGFVTTIFRVDGRLIFPSVLRSDPFEGYVEWKKPQELCTEHCSFADYFFNMFSFLGLL